MSKHVVLLGAGHAHIHVLKMLAKARQRSADANNPNSVVGARITVVSPYASLAFPAMIPGWIAGHYNLADCEVPVQPLADAAKAQWIQSKVVSIDRAKKSIALLNGEVLQYDFLSLNTGAVANIESLPGAREHGILLRPLEQFIAQWENVSAQISNQSSVEKHAHIVVIGGGASGVEIALAARHHFMRPGFSVGVTLIAAHDADAPESAAKSAYQSAVQQATRREGVSVMHGQCVEKLSAGFAHLASGAEVAADYFIVATGAAAAPYLRASGLYCDAQGFVRTNAHLQSVNDAAIFAVGDCATMDDAKQQRSGVHALRAAQPLGENLMRALQGKNLKVYRPKYAARFLISTGAKHAISVSGDATSSGRLAWEWKNWLDRGFVRKYR